MPGHSPLTRKLIREGLEGCSPVTARLAPRGWQARGVRVPLVAGQTYAAWHPFKREEYTPIPDEGPETGGVMAVDPPKSFTWVPGWRYEPCGPEDSEEVWDGEGLQLRRVVSLHKPGPAYPERVFYVREWQSPDGRRFGKSALRCTIVPTFRAWLHGERWPAYSPARQAHGAWAERAA